VKLEYLHLPPETAVPYLAPQPFRAILIADISVNDKWRSDVANWLVECGCLYVIVWGVDCKTWHDFVDLAVIESFNFGDIPEDRFVMTTWHDNESLPEVFWFAGNGTSHPVIDLETTLIVHVSEAEQRTALIEAYLASQNAPDGS